MLEPQLKEKFEKRIHRADRIIIFCGISILILVIVLFSIVIWQNQVNSDRSRANATENHKRTQAYIKCVGEALLVPISERQDGLIDRCTINADNNTDVSN